MNKAILTILLISILNNFTQAQTTPGISLPIDSLSIALPPCQCIPRIPCPTASFSHNGACPCPTIQNGVFSKTYWLTGDVFETGSGPRTHTYIVSFPRAFCRVPFVSVANNHLDSFSGANLRYTVSVGTVTATNFRVIFTTWADTKIYGLGISYLAYV